MGVRQILWVKKLIFHVFGGHFDILKLINNWYKTQLTSLKKNLSEIRPFTITSNRIFRNHSDFLFLTKVSGYLPHRVRFFQKVLSSSEQYFHGMNYRENPNFINFFFSFFLSFNLSTICLGLVITLLLLSLLQLCLLVLPLLVLLRNQVGENSQQRIQVA